MNIHEYQAKDVLRRYGVPIPPGEVATTPDEAEAIARRVAKPVMVKAQVHVGGRGKAGGVKFCPTPEKIKYFGVDPRYGLLSFEAQQLGFFLYQDAKQARAAGKIMQQLYQAFVENGCSLAEINPLVVTPVGEVIAVDAKMVIDDNELERRKDLESLRDESSEEPSEVDARNANLTFIKLDGNVGCIVNGAGLAMATMDLVKYYGGEPANFLDIGGSSNPEKVVNALRIITSDPNVKAILFNIFGGITRTDDVANGIVTATKQNPLKVPIVIRLTGTNEEIAVKILEENGFTALTDMDEAVKKAVQLATEGGK